jgi:hypothetical protein
LGLELIEQNNMSRFTFPEWTEALKKWINLLALGAPVYLVFIIWYGVSPEAIRIGYQPVQPVPYSHALHAGELGMDCRYCHSTVERAPKAAIPPAATCMNCHSQVKKDSDKLIPIREAFAENGESVRWTRVHNLPDYVYFNHQAHVNAAIGCESCHGRIDQMVQVFQAKPLTMGWCIECHKDPTPYLRNPENVTKMGYDDPQSTPHREPGEGDKVFAQNSIHPSIMCSTCHR